MSKQLFISLLCIYLIVIVLNFVVERVCHLPEHVISAKPNRKAILSQKSRLYYTVFMLGNVLVFVCLIAGFFGMFVFWHVAPWLFAVSIVGKVLLFPTAFWKVRNGLESMFGDIELLLDGVIVTLVFFGPAKHLFWL